MRAARTPAMLALTGAAAAVLAGCGSSGGGSAGTLIPSGAPGGSIKGLLAASVDKTEAAKNAKLHIDFSGSAEGKDLSFAGDGIADFAAKKFEMTINLPSAAGISGSVEERVIGKELYLKVPAAESGLSGGKPWIKFDPSMLGASGATGLNFTGEDPTQLLATLRGVSDSVTTVGTQEVRGVETTHYRAQVNLAKAVEKSGADVPGFQDFVKTLGSTTIPEDVYLDSSGLPRRFAVTINPYALLPSSAPSAAASAAAGSTFTVTVDMYDFGTTDTSGIVAPPADQVGDLSSLLGDLGKLGSGAGTPG